MDKNKLPVKNLFGIGQGYSTFSSEIVNGSKARADAVNLYNTHIAKKLFKSIDYFLNTNNEKIVGELRKNFNDENKLSDQKLKSSLLLNSNVCEKPSYTGVIKNQVNNCNNHNQKSSSNSKIVSNVNNQFNNIKISAQFAGNDQKIDIKNKFLNNNDSTLIK